MGAAIVATVMAAIVWRLPDYTMVEPVEGRWLTLTFAVLAWLMFGLHKLFSRLANRNSVVPFAIAIFQILCQGVGWVIALVSVVIALAALANLY
jgi:hypothetical protein